MRAMQASLAVAAIAAALLTGSARAASTTVSIPLSQTAFVSCADGGLGEFVELTGRLQIVQSETFDAAGGIHLHSHFNPKGVSGTGLSSGATYRGVGVTSFQLNLTAGVEQVSINNFLVIGTGSAPSFRLHETLVFVLNANGTVTATVDNFRVTCE